MNYLPTLNFWSFFKSQMCISGTSWEIKIFHNSGPTCSYHSYWLEVDTGVALHIISLMLRLSVSYHLLVEKWNTSCILVSSTRSKVKDRPRRLPMSRKMGENKREYFVCVHVREKYSMHLTPEYVCFERIQLNKTLRNQTIPRTVNGKR